MYPTNYSSAVTACVGVDLQGVIQVFQQVFSHLGPILVTSRGLCISLDITPVVYETSVPVRSASHMSPIKFRALDQILQISFLGYIN